MDTVVEQRRVHGSTDVCSKCTAAIELFRENHFFIVIFFQAVSWKKKKNTRETLWNLTHKGRGVNLLQPMPLNTSVPIRPQDSHRQRGDGTHSFAVRVPSQPPSLSLQVGQAQRVGRISHTLPVFTCRRRRDEMERERRKEAEDGGD